MANVGEYIKESYTELVEKVTWPTWRELQGSAVLVLVATIIIAMLVFGMDQAIGWLLRSFYHSI
jgi:preprotein translocase subunit SecE